MEGITVGDVGEKLGYNAVDNGFVNFNQVRIPRTNMLSRFVEVDKTGSVNMKSDPRMIYQIMVQTRMLIIFGSAYILLLSARWATRYAVCRRQFRTQVGTKEERKLIDYQTHMFVLGTNLANAFACFFAAHTVSNLCDKALTHAT
jgi:acyl-CoA oxidase